MFGACLAGPVRALGDELIIGSFSGCSPANILTKPLRSSIPEKFGPNGPSELQLRGIIRELAPQRVDELRARRRRNTRHQLSRKTVFEDESSLVSSTGVASTSTSAASSAAALVNLASCSPGPRRGNAENLPSHLNGGEQALLDEEEEFVGRSLAFLQHYENRKASSFSPSTSSSPSTSGQGKLQQCASSLRTRHMVEFLTLFNQAVQDDCRDLLRPPDDLLRRSQQDVFDGVLTKAVNSQLIKDIPRAEWNIEGQGFTFERFLRDNMARGQRQENGQQGPHLEGTPTPGSREEENQRNALEEKEKEHFQRYFVEKLERYLLKFCGDQKMGPKCTEHLINLVTTQMCQCGLANLDTASYARDYLVSGKDLEQTTVYSLTRTVNGLVLHLMCMKRNFLEYYYVGPVRGVTNEVGEHQGGAEGELLSADTSARTAEFSPFLDRPENDSSWVPAGQLVAGAPDDDIKGGSRRSPVQPDPSSSAELHHDHTDHLGGPLDGAGVTTLVTQHQQDQHFLEENAVAEEIDEEIGGRRRDCSPSLVNRGSSFSPDPDEGSLPRPLLVNKSSAQTREQALTFSTQRDASFTSSTRTGGSSTSKESRSANVLPHSSSTREQDEVETLPHLPHFLREREVDQENSGFNSGFHQPPRECGAQSYLYQHGTLQFVATVGRNGDKVDSNSVTVTVLDAVDEVKIV
ncbi:unnamed protein product [Amoebophrya sp. A25]|nr:unnamed protein product [Amoebophrya sp. A25]|eukprot:GSA25T00003436001.1